MLTLYFKDTDEKIPTDVVCDAELAFGKQAIPNIVEAKNLLMSIDGASYSSNMTFIDRFGIRLNKSELSTGCKVALLVLCNPDRVYDIKECGNNARDAIVRYCRNGNIVLKENGADFRLPDDADIDVRVLNYRFRTGKRFKQYMQDERDLEFLHDMSDVEIS